jgi:hypothetical protein
MPHLTFTLLAAALLASAMALEGRRPVRERLYIGIYRFLCCLATILIGSWSMYLIHR